MFALEYSIQKTPKKPQTQKIKIKHTFKIYLKNCEVFHLKIFNDLFLF